MNLASERRTADDYDEAVGLNLFVIQNLMRGTTARDVTLGTTPYVVLMVLLVVLLFLVPDLALWLPRHMAPGR